MDHDHDVIIAGGGLNGPTLALALAGAGLSVAVVDARPAPDRAAHGFAPSIRIGLHAGEATARDGDYFGSAVTRAARIAAAAGAGEVLASASLVAGLRRVVPLSGERTLALKGIAEPVAAVLVTWDEAAEA